jgi:hypothetical protein
MQVWSKWASNEGHIILDCETVFHPYLPSKCSVVTEKSHIALPAHVQQLMQVWSKSVSNEGHFTLEAERVLRPYFALYYCVVTGTLHVAITTHAP